MTASRQRAHKDGPWCWASKEALRTIHDAFSETDNLPSGLSVYMALTMIASDEQAERFTVRKALIAFKAGVSIRTAGDVLKRLETMQLVGVVRHSTTGTTPDGASTYTLLGVGNGCTGVGNGCAPVGNQPERLLIADKVEESEKNNVEESQKEIISAPPAPRLDEILSDAVVIYRSYPRRKAPIQAQKAIEKALVVLAKRGQSNPAAWLRDRVIAYAKSRRGEDEKFTPYPATWFNAGSYDEDFLVSSDRPGGINGHAVPAPIKPLPSSKDLYPSAP